MRVTTGWQGTDGSTVLQRVPLERRDLRDDDIAVRVDYCGVCHSDLHAVRGLMGPVEGGLVPGHEFTGTVTAVGPAVTSFAPGDRVAVGTVVDSCGACPMCQAGQENYCYEGATTTYGGTDRVDGTVTKGGYSREYVLREKFAYRLPDGLDPAAAAPLMCAGITMWEPLRAAGAGPGSQVAVAGLGGLGHLGVKLAVALGDRVAVGTIVDSCGDCAMCQAGQENYCYQGATSTYGGTDRIDGTPTQGGYSREYVLREKFAYRLPDGLDPAAAAPLMCAGITMWEPLRAAGVGPGRRVAVAGLGGLGHLGVKLAAALGAEVTVLSRTPDKADDARALGATDLLVSTDAGQLERARGRFDLILDTISAPHDLSPLLGLLALDGTLSVVGFPIGEIPLRIMDLTYGRKNLSSSGTGGRRGTAEMLAFCAEHGITADIELLPSAKAGEALDRLDRGDVRYRFVLDLSDLG